MISVRGHSKLGKFKLSNLTNIKQGSQSTSTPYSFHSSKNFSFLCWQLENCLGLCTFQFHLTTSSKKAKEGESVAQMFRHSSPSNHFHVHKFSLFFYTFFGLAFFSIQLSSTGWKATQKDASPTPKLQRFPLTQDTNRQNDFS